MATGECHVCGSPHPPLLHNAPHLDLFAACVLRHNSGSFCPVCFDVYGENTRPAPHSRIMCLRCPALAHITCLPSGRSSPAFRYLCSQCSDPSFSFLGSAHPVSDREISAAITENFAKQFLCAASMHRAAAVARAEAEQKVMGAVLARQNAKEAIDRVACLMWDQQTQDESDVVDG